MIKWIALALLLTGCSMITAFTARGEGLMFEFSNPSFSGQGFSTHALSIAQLEFNRKKDVEDDIASAEAKAAREEANSILNKFLNNVESRIYAQLSKQLVDNMFGICDPGVTECTTTDSGVATVEGAEISWVRDSTTGTITLNIISEDGTTTTITVPIDGFGF
tara:strand:+ start:42 stop:530 length:489 start_codon:yes stop_codon:yes gene_type:complete